MIHNTTTTTTTTTTTFLNIVDAGMAWRHSIVNIIDRV